MKVNLYNNNHTRCILFLRIENEFMHNSSSLHLDDDQNQTGRKNGRKYGKKERKKKNGYNANGRGVDGYALGCLFSYSGNSQSGFPTEREREGEGALEPKPPSGGKYT